MEGKEHLGGFTVVNAPDLDAALEWGRRLARATKRRLFERTGVREYWLVDPALDTVHVFGPSPGGKLARVAELAPENGDTLTTLLLPGCAINLPELFHDSA